MRTIPIFILTWLTGLCAAQAQSTYEPLQDRQAYLKAVSATPKETTGFEPVYHDESYEHKQLNKRGSHAEKPKTDSERIPKTLNTESSSNHIYLSLGGGVDFMSLNYERLLLGAKDQINRIISFKTGVGRTLGCLWGECTDKLLVIPVHITGNAGWRSYYLEAGIGYGIVFGTSNALYIPLGYRLQPSDLPAATFRINFNVPISTPDEIGFGPLGLSMGVSF